MKTTKTPLCLLASVILSTACVAALAPELKDSYAIVATKSVANDSEWKAATIDKLLQKYPHAKVFIWDKTLDEILPQIKELQPSFTAFVGKPEETTRDFVMTTHYFTRMFDDDPYVDTLWGIITGYDAASAALVAGAKDISIERAFDCSGTDLQAFNEGWRYSEDYRGTMHYWKRGMKEIEKSPCSTDNTQGVLQRLKENKIQFFATSGHATEHDWQMGYCGPNMQMRHEKGELYALDTKYERHPAGSTEPKVYFANGNCLIGNIDKVDCMALSWMRDGGARQMMGYTVTTWFGAQGWGTLGLFVDHSGLCTAAEAFHFTNTSIVKTIKDYNIPDMMTWKWTTVGHMNVPQTKGMQAYAQAEYAKDPSIANGKMIRSKLQDMAGNLHDRDSVAFYGDPALETVIANGRLTVHAPTYVDGVLTLSLTANEGVRKGDVWFRLPGSWNYAEADIVADEGLGKVTLVLDNMVRFSPEQVLTSGKTYTVKIQKATRKGTYK